MRKILRSFLLFVLAICLLLPIVACKENTDPANPTPDSPKDKGTWNVTSPDGTVTTAVTMGGDNQLTYSVHKGDTTVVSKSALGLTVKEDDFRLVSLEGVKEERVRGAYENKSGKHSEVAYDCNQLTLTLKGYSLYLDVIVRTYDDGYAFRYHVRGAEGKSGSLTVTSEDSEFCIPERSDVWAQPYTPIQVDGEGNFFSYENPYPRRQSNGFDGIEVSMPMLYKTKGSDVYTLITESDLIGSGFYGSFLKETDENKNTGKFGLVHSPAGKAEDDNRVAYPFTSPWRVGIVGDLKTVMESEMAEKVLDNVTPWRPDNYNSLSAEEKKIYTYDWVDPDVSAWNWLICNYRGQKGMQSNFEFQKKYVDLAAEMGWKYTILDGAWDNGLSESKMRDFMQYADSKGVKVIVWCNALNTFGNGNAEALRYTLDEWKSYGIAGIKIDFFDGQNATDPTHYGEDIETIKWYETVYQETAKRQMLVNCHGSNKPTGERRRYPHVINREGLMGNEMTTVDSSVTVNQLFTRAVIGPSDFTPVVIPLSNNLTMGHQMALAVLFETGMPSMADDPDNYKSELINDFYRALPAARKNTLFLSGEPDAYYCGAIEALNGEWFVGCANSIMQSDVTVDFSFLGEGKYEVTLIGDSEASKKQVTRQSFTVTKNDRKTLTVAEDGGFVMHIVRLADE